MTLGSLIIIHNAIEHDYCVKECIESVLPICDKVLIVECESTDGTPGLLADLAENEQKIRIIQRPWRPSLNMQWMRDLTNDCKREIGTDWYIAMDADEVVDPRGYCWIREHVATHHGTEVCAVMPRLTFWKDTKHTIPNGIICNHLCVRVGPTSISLCGDLLDTPKKAQIPSRLYHYGHLRKRPAWAKKSVEMHQAAFGEVPNHWKEAAKGNFTDVDSCIPDERLVEFKGSHPMLAREWLKERGFET